MNYEKHYSLLCQTRQQLNRQKLPASHADYVYYELHHIVPRHEAGSDEASNLVLLTAREHFIAHWLFAKWKRTSKAWAALSCMRKSKFRLFTARQYEICRLANSFAFSGSGHPMFGKTHTEEAKARIGLHSSLRNKGTNNPMFGKPGVNKGKILTQAEKDKQAIARFQYWQNKHGYCLLSSSEKYKALLKVQYG